MNRAFSILYFLFSPLIAAIMLRIIQLNEALFNARHSENNFIYAAEIGLTEDARGSFQATAQLWECLSHPSEEQWVGLSPKEAS